MPSSDFPPTRNFPSFGRAMPSSDSPPSSDSTHSRLFKIAQCVTMESISDSHCTFMSHMQVRLKLLCDPERSSTMLRRVKHALGLRSYGIQKATDLDEATRTARALATWLHFDYIMHKTEIGDE